MTDASGDKPKRVVGRPFAKGQSGNPSGLPKELAEVIRLARQHTESSILTLAEISTDPNAPAAPRVAAAQALLDRAWGKPKQEVEHAGPDGKGIPVSVAITFVRPE